MLIDEANGINGCADGSTSTLLISDIWGNVFNDLSNSQVIDSNVANYFKLVSNYFVLFPTALPCVALSRLVMSHHTICCHVRYFLYFLRLVLSHPHLSCLDSCHFVSFYLNFAFRFDMFEEIGTLVDYLDAICIN